MQKKKSLNAQNVFGVRNHKEVQVARIPARKQGIPLVRETFIWQGSHFLGSQMVFPNYKIKQHQPVYSLIFKMVSASYHFKISEHIHLFYRML